MKKIMTTPVLALGSALALFAAGCGDDKTVTKTVTETDTVVVGLTVGPDVAIFMNPDYVGTSIDTIIDDEIEEASAGARDLDNGDEASNLFYTLGQLGYNPIPFLYIEEEDLEDVTATAGVIVIPEQEGGSLSEDLSDEALTVLQNFVSDGGLIVAMGQSVGKTADLINDLTGADVSNGGSGDTATIQEAAGNTVFQGGPSFLPNANGTYPLDVDSLPESASVFYANDDDGVFAAAIPSGDGSVVFLAYDWYNGWPIGHQDSGWVEILARALNYEGPLPLNFTSVALLTDNDYVEFTLGDEGAEASNEYLTLNELGYHVQPWYSIDTEATARALFGRARVAVIPEQENGWIIDDIDEDAWYLLYNFVEAGNVLIVHGTSCEGDTPDIDLIESFFETDLDCVSGEAVEPITRQFGDNSFSNAPETVGYADGTYLLDPESLPENTTILYTDDNGDVAAVIFWTSYYDEDEDEDIYGAIIWLGHDWYDAAPFGTQDEGWSDVLDASIRFQTYVDDDD